MRAARSIHPLLVPAALALFAAGCEDSALLQEPPDPEPTHPVSTGQPSLTGPHWASGYTLAGSPLTPYYELTGSNFTYNLSGGIVSITKPAETTGRYIVRFAGLSALLGGRSTVHANAYTSDATYCKPAQGYLANDKVEVRCFDARTRAPANAGFTLLVLGKTADPAFAYAHQPTGTDYSPSGAGSWNPAGSSRVFRDGTGQYRVVLNGFGGRLTPSVGGHPQVNAVGTGKAHCKALDFGGSPNLTVRVRCYAAGGGLVDSKFTVLFTTPSAHLAYAWGDRPTTLNYTPFPGFTSNPAGGTVYVSRHELGRYLVEWTGIEAEIYEGGTVQAMAYGTGNAQCKGEDIGEAFAVVRCFKPDGSPVDSHFMVLFGS